MWGGGALHITEEAFGIRLESFIFYCIQLKKRDEQTP